jgi:tripartite-type tricarboxylate transporter receptor subunit TctC
MLATRALACTVLAACSLAAPAEDYTANRASSTAAGGFVRTAVQPTPAYPTRTVRLVIPFPPGGSPDIIARLIAPKVSESLGQNFIVDNRAGASGNIGMELVARAPGDGYTLLVNTVPLVANPSLFPNLPFQPEKDFAPISLLVANPSIIVVHPSLPARNLKDLISLAKAKPGMLKYTTSGPGTIPHLAGELLKYYTGTDIVHVAYRGRGQSLTAVIAGECEITLQTMVSGGSQVAAGRLRAIAVTGRRRLAPLPDVPTVAESGVPQYEFDSWVGILAPASTPQAIVRLLNDHVVKAVRAPDLAERFAHEGIETVASTPEAFQSTIAEDTALWAKVIKAMGIKAE